MIAMPIELLKWEAKVLRLPSDGQNLRRLRRSMEIRLKLEWENGSVRQYTAYSQYRF